MTHLPPFPEFEHHAQQSSLVPVFRQLVSDTLTPVSAYTLLAESDHSFLFESVVGGERVGRYSFLGSSPFLTLEAYRNEIRLTKQGAEPKIYSVEDPLEELESQLKLFQACHVRGLPRFCGGAVGYAGYDVVRYTENLPDAPEDDRQLPDYSFSFYNEMVVFDHINKTVLVVAHARTEGTDCKQEYENACKRVDRICERLKQPVTQLSLLDIAREGKASLPWKSNFKQEDFKTAVEKCKEYITAGDIFQVVLSQRLELETKAKPLDIYRSLRVVNPSPFMFLLNTPNCQLVGSSPEIMVRAEDGRVTVRPLAGTRPRGASDQEDLELAEDLLADPKERAEHVMLIDLARNDVGRVAQFGSVELSDVMVVEKYSHVMHITSNVNGQLVPDKSALDALRASLPAGTVSGSPKVRAMEIIDEFEPNRRGPYAGAVGYIDFTGNMDTCIALRTLVMIGNKAYIQAGAGLVADSVPETEYQETLNKAMGLLKAVEVAERQLCED